MIQSILLVFTPTLFSKFGHCGATRVDTVSTKKCPAMRRRRMAGTATRIDGRAPDSGSRSDPLISLDTIRRFSQIRSPLPTVVLTVFDSGIVSLPGCPTPRLAALALYWHLTQPAKTPRANQSSASPPRPPSRPETHPPPPCTAASSGSRRQSRTLPG